MRRPPQKSLFELPGAHCLVCGWQTVCGAALTEHACPDRWGDPRWGGENAIHPLSPDLEKWMASLHGPEYETVGARPATIDNLGDFLPQIRNRAALRGHLDAPAYGVRPREILRGWGVVTARRLRRFVGLEDEQRLIALLFDKDVLLERLWNRNRFEQLAHGGYDIVVAPSYSSYTRRPRTEFLVNAKRSLAFFEGLQQHGVTAIPRMTWNLTHDAQRAASWINDNRPVEWVALDWMTTRAEGYWHIQLDGLALFDQLTGRRLHFLINGPSTIERIVDIYRATSADRVCITNARTAAPSETPGLTTGAAFADRWRRERERIAQARLAVADIEAQARVSPVAHA